MNKKLTQLSWALVSALAFIIVPAGAFAKEPRNLSFCKQDIIRYYDSHQYDEDVGKVIANALRYLNLRLKQPSANIKQPALILDIDETALSNYPNIMKMNFGGTSAEITQAELQANDPVITPTLKLFRFATSHHIAVIFITGRPERERKVTIQNLQNAGYKYWQALYMRSPQDTNKTALAYKSALRKQLSAKYDIWLNIGDQVSDLNGGYADKTFKLPNPMYYIP